MTLSTHSFRFIASLASSTDVYDVSTLSDGLKGLYLCFLTSSGSRKGPWNRKSSSF